jgi:PTS system nitrogen regulatory IIA component
VRTRANAARPLATVRDIVRHFDFAFDFLPRSQRKDPLSGFRRLAAWRLPNARHPGKAVHDIVRNGALYSAARFEQTMGHGAPPGGSVPGQPIRATIVNASPMEGIPMNMIADLLRPEDVILDRHVGSKNALFEEIGQHLQQTHGLQSSWVVGSLSRREQAGSTGLGEGVAIPHARVDGLDRILVLYVRLKAPIPFGATDGKPVSDVVVLLVPKPATDEHLAILAEATEMLSDPHFRQRLHACTQGMEVKRLLELWSPRS